LANVALGFFYCGYRRQTIESFRYKAERSAEGDVSMTTEPLDVDAAPPDRMEVQAAERLSKTLASRLAHGESPAVILAEGESGAQEALPATAARLLVKILTEIAKGNAVTVVPLKPELTTQAEVLAYKRKAREERKAILRELVALNQDMGLYD
jgi:hypothetical protein